MKNLILQTLFLCIFMLANAAPTKAVTAPKMSPQAEKSVFDLPAEDLLQLNKDQLSEKLGRKLKWKEKIALKWVVKKIKKQKDLNPDRAFQRAQIDGFAVAGFVLSLIGLLSVIGGIILGILGIVFSGIALSRIRRDPEYYGGRSLAIAGLVLGILSLILWAFVFSLALIGAL